MNFHPTSQINPSFADIYLENCKLETNLRCSSTLFFYSLITCKPHAPFTHVTRFNQNFLQTYQAWSCIICFGCPWPPSFKQKNATCLNDRQKFCNAGYTSSLRYEFCRLTEKLIRNTYYLGTHPLLKSNFYFTTKYYSSALAAHQKLYACVLCRCRCTYYLLKCIMNASWLR